MSEKKGCELQFVLFSRDTYHTTPQTTMPVHSHLLLAKKGKYKQILTDTSIYTMIKEFSKYLALRENEIF